MIPSYTLGLWGSGRNRGRRCIEWLHFIYKMANTDITFKRRQNGDLHNG